VDAIDEADENETEFNSQSIKSRLRAESRSNNHLVSLEHGMSPKFKQDGNESKMQEHSSKL